MTELLAAVAKLVVLVAMALFGSPGEPADDRAPEREQATVSVIASECA